MLLILRKDGFRMGSNGITLVVISVLSIPSRSIGGFAEQTDWSGGGGVYGPVQDWGTSYCADTDVRSYSNPSDLSLAKPLLIPPSSFFIDSSVSFPTAVEAADINGDGATDIMSVCPSEGLVLWWSNDDGAGTSWTEHEISSSLSSPLDISDADLNGDGYPDAVTVSPSDMTVCWWENSDGTGSFWTRHDVDTDASVSSVTTCDIDCDGFTDIVAARSVSPAFYWWENIDGSGLNWERHTVQSAVNGVFSVETGDVNADGFPDIVGGTESYYNAVFWWENPGERTRAWTRHLVEDYFERPVHAVCADMNGDETTDVAGVADWDGMVVWWGNMGGTGTAWSWNTVSNGIPGASSVSAEDINGDGYIDLAVSAGGSSSIYWWQNGGSGTDWVQRTITSSFEWPSELITADLNGDRYADVIAASESGDRIAWWNLTDAEYYPQGELVSSILDVEEDHAWEFLDWNFTGDEGTGVSFQIRASDNPASMGVWSDTIHAPGSIEGLVGDSCRYFQYKAILLSNTTDKSPFLHDVTVFWNSVSGTEGQSSLQNGLYCTANPVRAGSSLVLFLSEESDVQLRVFDLTGRTVISSSGSRAAGYHQTSLGDLPAGVYTAWVSAGDEQHRLRFVVTR